MPLFPFISRHHQTRQERDTQKLPIYGETRQTFHLCQTHLLSEGASKLEVKTESTNQLTEGHIQVLLLAKGETI